MRASPSIEQIPMLTKCANASCDREFRYAQNGKAFRVETQHPAGSERAVEHYWLCDECMVLILPLLGDDMHLHFPIPHSEATRRVSLVRIDEAIAADTSSAEPHREDLAFANR
jgi:hypothetical protein